MNSSKFSEHLLFPHPRCVLGCVIMKHQVVAEGGYCCKCITGLLPSSFSTRIRPGSQWRMKWSNWLVISAAGLVSATGPRLKVGFLNSPHPSPPSPPVLEPGCGNSGSAEQHPDSSREGPGAVAAPQGQHGEQSARAGACYFLCFV